MYCGYSVLACPTLGNKQIKMWKAAFIGNLFSFPQYSKFLYISCPALRLREHWASVSGSRPSIRGLIDTRFGWCAPGVSLRLLKAVRRVELKVVERLDAPLSEDFGALDGEAECVDRI